MYVCVYEVQTLFPGWFKVGFWMGFRCVMGPRHQGQTGSPVLEKTQHYYSPNLTFIQRTNPAGFTVHHSGSFHKRPSQVEGSHNRCVCVCVCVYTLDSFTHFLGSRMKVGQSSSENTHKQTQGKDTHIIHHSNKSMLLIFTWSGKNIVHSCTLDLKKKNKNNLNLFNIFIHLYLMP